MANPQSDDKRPQPDPAEDNAFFPSPYSLGQFTAPKSNRARDFLGKILDH